MNAVLLKIALALGLSMLAHAEPAFITFPADVDWVTRTSPHFEAIYRRGQDDLALRVLKAAEHAHTVLSPIFPPGPGFTRLILADFQDSTNGYALNFPYPHIVLFLSPPDAIGNLAALDDWIESLVMHEYVHILHLYPATGLWGPLRTIFGTIIVPNGMLPSHLHEGLATYLETQMTLGGRGRGASFRAGRRMSVKAGRWNLDSQPLDRFEPTPVIWPMGVSPYFYGYYLYEELWNRKGKEGIYKLTDSYSNNWPYFVHGPLKEVYGVDYKQIWTEIYKKTGETVKQEIAAIERGPLSPLTVLSSNGYYKWDVRYSPDGKRAVHRNTDPKEGGTIRIVDPEKGTILQTIDLNAGANETLCWGTRKGKEALLFPRVVKANSYATNYLGGYWLAADESFTLNEEKTETRHVNQIACSKDLERLLVYQESGGKGVVKEMEWADKDKSPGVLKEKRKWAIPVGSWVSGLLIHEGNWIALREGLKTVFYRWDKGDPTRVVEIPTHAFNLRPGTAPGQILAIAAIDGRDEVWQISPAKKETRKTISVLGGVLSFDEQNGKYLVSRYDVNGYDLAKAVPIQAAPFRLAGVAKAKRVVASTEKVSGAENYSAWSTILPRTWIPSILFVPDGVQFGVWIPGFDIAQRHFYDIFGGYDTRGLPFALLAYHYRFLNKFTLNTSAYLLPSYLSTQREFQKRWGGNISLSGQIDPVPPTIGLGVAYRRIERSVYGAADQSIGPEISLSYKMGFKERPLDISPIHGTSLNLSHSQFFKALGSYENHFVTTAGIEQHVHAPWADGHVFFGALRAGYAEGNTLFNSYLLGGGELIFSQGRGYFLNRGFLPESFIARRIVNLNLEYRLPLFRVDRGLGLWPIHLHRVHAALVADATTRDRGRSHPRDTSDIPKELFKVYFPSVGAELKTDWHFGFYLPSQIRLGAYHGFGPRGEKLYVTLGVEASL